MPAASLAALIDGAHSIGAVQAHEVMIFEDLMDPKSLFLTANSSTIYAIPDLDLKRDGPTVVETPDGLLGAANDGFFRFINNFAKAGKYLLVPPGYEGEIPDGYIVLRPKTYRIWVFLRASPKSKAREDVLSAANFIKENLKVYPLTKASGPPKMRFVNASGKEFNTIHYNNVEFFHHLNDVVQYEAPGLLTPEVRGLFASIGIEQGRPFEPDARMQKILEDGVAIANAGARSIVWYPRYEMNMRGVRIYPDTDSAWIMAYTDRNVNFNGRDGRTMNEDARVMFHYPYTAVTPAMAAPREGKGSDYGIAYVDADKNPFDGDKTYKLRLPANAPVGNFWAVTVYDPMTRSMLQTDQATAGVDSLKADALNVNVDGSVDIYFGPKPPKGYENNWVQTIPGKGWFTILRMYSPLEPWIDQTWRPSEVELVD